MLYYQKGDQLFAATVRADDGFEVVATRTLPYQATFALMDIHPDGRLLIVDVAGATPDAGGDVPVRRLIVTTNWFTELTARLGVDD